MVYVKHIISAFMYVFDGGAQQYVHRLDVTTGGGVEGARNTAVLTGKYEVCQIQDLTVNTS